MKNERIACSCIAFVDGFVLVIPNMHLFMDAVNRLMENQSYLYEKMLPDTFYITTFGRVVSDVEAFPIALEANQLVETPSTTKKLNPLDIWPRRK